MSMYEEKDFCDILNRVERKTAMKFGGACKESISMFCVLRTQPSAPPQFSFTLDPPASPNEAQLTPFMLDIHTIVAKYQWHLRVNCAAYSPSALPPLHIEKGESLKNKLGHCVFLCSQSA